MFADPTVVTINTVAKSLVRINQDKYSSEYLLRTAIDEYRLHIRNSSYMRKTPGGSVLTDRHNVELVHTVFPIAPATLAVTRKTYVIVENQQGDTLVDPMKVAAGLFVFLSEANITKLMNSES